MTVGTAGICGAKIYPMTYEQESIWLDEQLYGRPSRYIASWVYRLSGPLDPDATEWALGRVVDRHEALRSKLTMEGDQLAQVVLPEHDTHLIRRPCPKTALDEELRKTVTEPLDLDASPLRATLLQIAPDESVLAVQLHHAVVDGWTLAVLNHEFGELYTARVQQRPTALAPVPMQLGEYAVAQRSAGIDDSVLRYWQKQLRQVPTQNSVRPDRPRPGTPSYQGGLCEFRIDADTGRLLRRAARILRATPFTVLATVLTGLLYGYNGTNELVLGTPVSHRGAAGLDGLIGCLTGLLPLRQAIGAERSLADLVTSTRAVLWEAVAHRDIPYATLVARAVSRKDLKAAALCQTVLVVNDAPKMPLNLPELETKWLDVQSDACKFDLCMTFVIDDGGYRAWLKYASDLYEAATAERVVRDFQSVLTAAVDDPGRSLLEILTRGGVNCTRGGMN